MLAAALRWTKISPVFPCSAQKTPLTNHSFYDATTDPATLASWWTRWPNALIGIPTGEQSGLIVLDKDVPSEDHKDDGVAAFEVLQAGRLLPPHPIVRSRSGGEHHYFSAATKRPVRNRASKMAPGVDQRGQGGYVIVPPSPGYVFIDRTWPPPLPPDWLLDLMAPPPKPKTQKPFIGVPRPLKQFAALIRCAANAREGERNARTYWAACRLGESVRLGHLSEGAAITMVAAAGQASGLPSDEATKTAISGVQMGMGHRA